MRKRYIIAAILAFILPAVAQAQLKISYFLDRSLQRTSLNPAFSPAGSYYFIPVLSGVELGQYSNKGVTDFIYSVDGQLYTFLNNRVSADEVMRNFKSDLSSRTKFNTDILGLGFHISKNLFLSFGMDAVADVNLKMPKEFFTALKQGGSTDTGTVSFDFDDASANVLTYAQFSSGLKYDMSSFIPGLSIGVRAKFAVIAAAAQARIDEGLVYLDDSNWKIRMDGTGYFAIQGIKHSSEKGFYKAGRLGTAGGGILFDLGFNYKMDLPSESISSISISASMLDFGSLTIKNKAMNAYGISGDFNYDSVFEADAGNASSEQTTTPEKNGLLTFTQLNEKQYKDQLLYEFSPAIYAGAEMSFMNDMVSAGLLYSKAGGRRDLTISANIKLKAFNFATSYSLSATRAFGCYIGFIPLKGVSLFVGSDFIPTRFTPQYIPVDNLNVNFRTGLSFVL